MPPPTRYPNIRTTMTGNRRPTMTDIGWRAQCNRSRWAMVQASTTAQRSGSTGERGVAGDVNVTPAPLPWALLVWNGQSCGGTPRQALDGAVRCLRHGCRLHPEPEQG